VSTALVAQQADVAMRNTTNSFALQSSSHLDRRTNVKKSQDIASLRKHWHKVLRPATSASLPILLPLGTAGFEAKRKSRLSIVGVDVDMRRCSSMRLPRMREGRKSLRQQMPIEQSGDAVDESVTARMRRVEEEPSFQFEQPTMEAFQIAFRKFQYDGSVSEEILTTALRSMGYREVDENWYTTALTETTTWPELSRDEFKDFVEKYNSLHLEAVMSEFVSGDVKPDGTMDADGVVALLESLGTYLVKGIVRELMKEISCFGDEVTKKEYVHLRELIQYRGGFPEADRAILYDLFQRHGAEDPEGKISPSGVESVIAWLTFSTPQEAKPTAADTRKAPTATQLLTKAKAVDIDGGIDFYDFLKVMHHYRECEIMSVRRLFDAHVNNDGGAIGCSVQVSVDLLHLHGFITIAAKEVEKCVMAYGVNCATSNLTFDDFFMALRSFRRREGFTHSDMEEYKSVFGKYAEVGSVNVVQLGSCTRWLGFRLKLEDLQDLLGLVDNDGSGEIEFDEFLKIIRKYREDEFDKLTRAFAKGVRLSPTPGDDGIVTALHAHEMRSIVLKELGFDSMDPQEEKIVNDHVDGKYLDFQACEQMMNVLRMHRRDEFRRLHGFTNEELVTMRELFENYAKGKEYIEQLQVGRLLSDVFPWASGPSGNKMIVEILNDVDQDGDGKLEWDEFIYLRRVAQDKFDNFTIQHEQEVADQLHFGRQEVKDLRQIFNFCDANGSRSCDHNELVKMLLSLHPKVDQKELRQIISEVDASGIGEVEFPDFMKVLRRIQNTHIIDLGI
jgi:Ca2+-binding EF-hand superfamily protein